MTVDHVARQAAERPDATAVVHDGRVVSYPEFHRDIRKVMGALRALGLARGNSVAVGTDDLYLHWLLLLASEGLGIGAGSFLASEGEIGTRLRASVDLVIAEPHFPATGSRRRQMITPDWTRGVLALAPAGEKVASTAPEDPVRLLRTSGTLGPPKQVMVLRRMHEALMAEGIACFGLNPRSRYLQSMPLVVRAAYDFGSGCLRMGGTLVLESRMDTLAAIGVHDATHAIYLPAQLNAAVEGLAADFVKPRELTILCFGADVPRALHEKATRRLATAVCDLYGTVEVGAVSVAWGDDGEGLGTLWPGSEAQVVDEQDRALPPGKVGHIGVKTPWMCERYLEDPAATRRHFRDGWFYPGDVGLARADRKLKVLGRADDLINIGGQKFQPAALEAWLVNREVAGDVGVCSLPNQDGVEELCIAVSGVRHDDQALNDRIQGAFQQTGRFHIARLDSIPRSPNGKLQRQRLKEEVERVLRSR